jgi:uncharacterized membrane protein (Fun14 family)
VGIAGGSPLPAAVRGYMEPRFGASFGNVRVHTTEPAAQQATALSAHAFTVGEHVFFGRDKFQPQSAPGCELIAHELTHTIQQGAAVQASVQRSADVTVTQRSGPRMQRYGVKDALDWIADKAYLIPGFRLLTIVLGMNPINWEAVPPSAANLLRAMLELVPVVGPLVVKALDHYQIIDKVAEWAAGKVRALGLVGSAIKRGLDEFLASLSWTDIFDLDDVYERGKRIFTAPIDQLIELGASIVADVLEFIRQAILLPLAALAKDTKGYDLLRAVLQEDPITGEKVPRTPDTVIGGFMKLIGMEEVWENAKKANAAARVWAWFEGALAGLLGFVARIPALFLDTLRSLEVGDLFPPTKAFVKVVTAFGNFALEFGKWALNTVWTLLEIVFDVVSPGALVYIKKTGAALQSILLNPIPFVLNLVKAAKLGFDNFADRFLQHLKAGLIEWLTGSLPGIYIPKAFSLVEVAKFAFSVLGLTWANIRAKLVKATNETTVKVLETTFDVVVTLVRDGPAAAWDQIKEQLANLKDMIIGGIVDMVVGFVTKRAIPKLVALFIPGAGFVSAILSIYETVMVFVNKLARIVEVVKSFVDSIVAIAGGAIDTAAKRVESTLAGLLSLAISFLAGFAGLGNVADKVMEVIEKVRAPIDKALDWLVGWIVKAAKGLVSSAKAGVKKLVGWWKAKTSFKAGGESHSLYFQGEGASAKLVVASAPQPVEAFLGEKAKKAKGDKDKQAAIQEVKRLLKEVDKAKAAAAKSLDKDPEKAQKEIEGLMNQIGEELVKLLSDDEWGTEGNPSPFDYPKRSAAAYPTFYLATGTLASLTQAKMQARLQAKPPKGAVDQVIEYQPTALTAVPDKSAKLGLGAASQVQVGKKVFFEDKEARGSGVASFKALVGKFGFVASESGWDVDHVVELQIGGKDQLDNLWPLPKGENRSSGSTIKNAAVEVPKTKEQKPVKQALEEKKKPGKGKKAQDGLWLLIKSTRQL